MINTLSPLPAYLKPGPNTGVKVLLRHPESLLSPEYPTMYYAQRRSEFFKDIFGENLPYDLPGGLADEEDNSLVDTAEREVRQELGVDVTVDLGPDGKPIIWETDEIPLQFIDDGKVVGVDLTRHFLSAQAFQEDVGHSEEHQAGSGLWLPLGDELLSLNFDPRMAASLGRIAAKLTAKV